LPYTNHRPNLTLESNLLLLIVQFTAIVVGPVIASRDKALEKLSFIKLDIRWDRNLLLRFEVMNTEVAELLLTPYKVLLSNKL
jgi:hypothetical protein